VRPRLEIAGIPLGGLSVGGVETCIDLPGHKVCFDLGRVPDEAIGRATVLFTHGHMDHLGGIAWHCATRALRGMPPPTYVVPPSCVEGLERLFDAWRSLDRSELPHQLVPIAPGEEHTLNRELVAVPFTSPHVVRTQGYGLWRTKRVLREEFAGRAGSELKRLRVAGTEITREVRTPEVCFTGDTTIEVVEREEVVRTARVLVIEVTFLDDRVSVEECRSRGHVHLDEVLERADLFENEGIVFSHASARYKAAEVREILGRRLPASLKERVVPLTRGLG
jgi:ribonuclease Z